MIGGWQTKKLAEVCSIRPPKSEARERISSDGLVSFAPMEDLGIDRKYLNSTQLKQLASVAGSYTYFAEGDVLLAKITPCFENGKLGIAKNLCNGVGFGSSEFVVLRPCANLDAEFLYYLLCRPDFRTEGAARMGGAVGQQRVPKEFIENYVIPVPPLPEQQRIVGILDKAFEAIATAKANAEKNIQNARALFTSYLYRVFECEFQENNTITLANLATDIIDGDHMPPPKAQTGVPFVTIGNIIKNTREIDFSDTFFVPRSYYQDLKPNRKPRRGDVLYTVTGSFGIPVLVSDVGDFCFQRHIGLVRPNPDVCSEWLYYLLMSPQLYEQAEVGATGTAQRTVSLGLLRNFQVPHTPLEKQRATARTLKQIEDHSQVLERSYQHKSEEFDILKMSILHHAFTG